MQPEAQTTTPGILAVSAGALEVLLKYIRRIRSGHTLEPSPWFYILPCIKHVLRCDLKLVCLVLEFNVGSHNWVEN